MQSVAILGTVLGVWVMVDVLNYMCVIVVD